MAGRLRRKGRPYDPAADKVHDRRSTDTKMRNREYGVLEVDDPYELGAKIVVVRSFRDDPLGRLHDRRQIDKAQYDAGRDFQRDFETAERGPRAIDPGKEAVDGGRMPEPITEEQKRAAQRLNAVQRELGARGSALVLQVLVHGLTLEQIAGLQKLEGERWQRYFGARFRECLETLAVAYGHAGRRA